MEVKCWQKCNSKDTITNEEKLKVREIIANRLLTWHNKRVEKLIVNFYYKFACNSCKRIDAFKIFLKKIIIKNK